MKNKNGSNIITLSDNLGNTIDYEILFTFHSDYYHRSYILLVPVDDPNSNRNSVIAFWFESGDENFYNSELYPIQNDKEWDMVDEMLEIFLNDLT